MMKKLEIPENRPHIQSFCGHKDATLFALKRLRSVMKQTSELRHLTIKLRLKIYTDTDRVTILRQSGRESHSSFGEAPSHSHDYTGFQTPICSQRRLIDL